MLLIPLSAEKSRGDQILNAKLFKSQGFAQVLYEEDLNEASFKAAIEQLIAGEERMVDRIIDAQPPKTPQEMVQLILQYEK